MFVPCFVPAVLVSGGGIKFVGELSGITYTALNYYIGMRQKFLVFGFSTTFGFQNPASPTNKAVGRSLASTELYAGTWKSQQTPIVTSTHPVQPGELLNLG